MSSANEDHLRLREMLGSYALGHLSDDDAAMLGAHVDGCAECRADLAEIGPLVGLLDLVDPAHFETPPAPPAGLGNVIRDRVAAERSTRESDELAARRTQRRRRVTTRIGLVAAAAVVVAGAVGGGLVLGRETAPEAAPTATVPWEPVALQTSGNEPVEVTDAGLVAHTWGVELRMSGSGFDQGEVFSAAFRDEVGGWVPAGTFLGTGTAPMVCNLQSSLLREEATQVVVLDATGDVVLTADL